ncbi:MAG: hypothetical protein LBT53_04475 [Puniceicoccales bacterium]|jgi:hypothetical protein|nr:hypothetical protein [Puniceicoccales bacterium]
MNISAELLKSAAALNPADDARNNLLERAVLGGIYAAKNLSSGGGGGTNDYTALLNKPLINGISLIGNKTAATLGLLLATSGNSLFFNESDGGGLVWADKSTGTTREWAGICLDQVSGNTVYPQLYVHNYNGTTNTYLNRALVELHYDGLYISHQLSGAEIWHKFLTDENSQNFCGTKTGLDFSQNISIELFTYKTPADGVAATFQYGWNNSPAASVFYNTRFSTDWEGLAAQGDTVITNNDGSWAELSDGEYFVNLKTPTTPAQPTNWGTVIGRIFIARAAGTFSWDLKVIPTPT